MGNREDLDLKRFFAALITASIILSLFCIGTDVKAAGLIKKKFDLGGKGTASGYIGVSATDKYDAEKGYGINDTRLAANVSANGTGALSDAIHFQGGNGHLKVDLPSGVYKITVTTGNVVSTTIAAEDVNQIFFMTGNNAVDSFTIPVTDGQLNIYASSGMGTVFSISAIEIEQISEDTVTKPTIWTCGDSTVASYYNVPDDSQKGWGMYLKDYVDTGKYDVRNVSVSGIRVDAMAKNYFPVVEKYGKKGDILILSMGINDYVDEYTPYVNSGDPIDPTKYITNMTDMVRRAKAKGMTVYLVKQHGEESDPKKYPLPSYKWFGKELEDIARAENVGVIDLFRPWMEMLLVNRYYDQEEYYQEGIHPNEKGARLLAQMVSSQLFPTYAYVPPLPDYITDPEIIYEAEVSGGPVKNPHKGFVMTSYAPHYIDSSLGYEYGIGGSADNHAWDCCTIVSGEPKWCELNPQKGQYDWSSIDGMLDMCEKYGLTYGIRILPFSSYNKEDYVPQWVYANGAKKNATIRKDNGEYIEFPVWDDPVYLQACKDFASALAEHYDGDPRVEFIDISIFGDWGEWHNAFAEGDYMPSLEIQKDMLSYYASAFDETLLVLPSDGWGEIYKYALSLGITKRDNGLICTPNIEWSLIPTYEANMPVIGENLWPYSTMKNFRPVRKNEYDYVNWTPQRFKETIEISHLSIMAFDQDNHSSYEFYNEHKAVIDEMCNRIGYNFTVTSAERLGNKLSVTIKNTGVAPAFFDIDLCAEITDKDGNKICNFGEPVLIGSGSFHDGEEKEFLFEYSGTLDEDQVICLSMYDRNNELTKGKDPTVRFDNKNTLSNNRLELVEAWRSPSYGNTDPGNGGSTPTTAPSTKPSSVPGTTSVSDPKKQISDFVKRLYKYVLNREAETDGLNYWTDELYSFRQSGAEVAQGFIFSKEFIDRKTTDEEFVTILYNTFFGREPDTDGFNFWVNSLKNGTNDRYGVARGFIFSQEWADTCAEYGILSGGTTKPSVSIKPSDLTYSFVERMYTTALKRNSDPDGKKYWSEELSNFRCTGEAVGIGFFLSDEMVSLNLSDEEFVTRLYKTFMDREPEKEGYDFWVKYLKNGNSRKDAVYGFTRSEEFVGRCIEARILPY